MLLACVMCAQLVIVLLVAHLMMCLKIGAITDICINTKYCAVLLTAVLWWPIRKECDFKQGYNL